MITKEKLLIYARYDGDIDAWVRCGTRKEHALMEDQDWHLIDGLVQDLELIEKELAAESFIEKVNVELTHVCDSEETVLQLRKLATR